jgi:hypothetical protein
MATYTVFHGCVTTFRSGRNYGFPAFGSELKKPTSKPAIIKPEPLPAPGWMKVVFRGGEATVKSLQRLEKFLETHPGAKVVARYTKNAKGKVYLKKVK